MIKPKSAPKVTMQYEGEEYDVPSLFELTGWVLASATISRTIFGVHLIDAIKVWWHYIW